MSTLRRVIAIGLCLAACFLTLGCDRRSDWDDVKVTTEHLERFARELRLTPEQQQAATDLLGAYQLQHAQALEKMQGYREAYAEATKKSETPEQSRHYKETSARYERHCRQLRDAAIADLRALLTLEQEARWPRFERWYRRGDLLPKGTLHGESVDIERLIESLALPVAGEGGLAELLDDYSLELDAALTARQRLLDAEKPEPKPDTPPAELAAAVERTIDDEHRARLRVRRVNFSFAERIEGALPGAQREPFRAAFNAAAYPEVFNREDADTAFAEVLKLKDLSAEQRAAIGQVRAEYDAALPEANRRWAEGIRREEDAQTARALLAKGQNPDAKPADDRAARDALDERTRKRVAAALSPAQRQRLSWLSSTAALPRIEF